MAARRILYVQYTNPAAYPPLEHSARLLADDGWHVMMLGAQHAGLERLRLAPHPRIRSRTLPACPPGWRQKLYYLAFTVQALAWFVLWRPRWVYVSDSLTCPVGWLLVRLAPHRVIYHEHDAPFADRARAFTRLCLRARLVVARDAALCVVPNARRGELLAAEVGRRDTVTVWNCPTRDEIGPPRRPRPPGDVWLLYHGSIVPPRLPLSVIEALALLPESVKLRIVGYETIGSVGYVRKLLDRAAALGVADRIDYRGPVPDRADLLACARASDIGLAFMPRDPIDVNQAHMTGASNKPFDYLASGMALLVSDLPDWVAMFVAPNYGRTCDPYDAPSLAAAVRWFLDHPGDAQRMGESGRLRVANEWNYETQFRPIRAALEAT